MNALRSFGMFLLGSGVLIALGTIAVVVIDAFSPQPEPARPQAFVERRLDVRLDEPQWVWQAPWRGPPRARLDCSCREVKP